MNLQLPLKTKWFELTKAGIKTEDYREINEYWYARLVDRNNLRSFKKASLAFVVAMANQDPPKSFAIEANRIYQGCFKPFAQNTMTLGYPKTTDTERILKLEHKGIEIRTGNPEWGAEPNKLYFVIKHGKPTK
ncbi:hypothetical protein [Thalassobellus suaedae]|uniref:Uncharacterized protein n=1 Tax=Thalassobellus suaedae TaxID=3074124 RepID=A0ABY9XVN8_9FLAO|nr:hypothetical protein RHP51_04865 [Flavobacteriaceae bacterium HL-DH14]